MIFYKKGSDAMVYLYNIYYKELNKEKYIEKYQNRLNNEFAIITPLAIRTKGNEEHNLFLNLTTSILHLLNSIRVKDKELEDIFKTLPKVASKSFLLDVIIDELKSSNDIEGVASTKKELYEVYRKISKNKVEVRFGSMITTYMNLMERTINPPKSPLEIRAIYDLLTKGEIDEHELPDGEIFRKDASVVKKSNSAGKYIHQGVTPESKIIQSIHEMISYLNEKSDLTNIIKIAIAHYYFGYIHPFYDGNGRTSRFISSIYMIENYSVLTSMAIARGCFINRREYLKAFDQTNSKHMKGEMNYFIDMFLETIVAGQNDIILRLKIKLAQYENAFEIINNDERVKTEKQRNVVFLLAQAHYFSFEKGLEQQFIMDFLNCSYPTLKTVIEPLIKKGIVEVIKSRPKIYALSDTYVDD